MVACTQSEEVRIRTSKRDSAFVYAVLEASEGIASFSTLPFQTSDPHRDLLIRFTPGFREEIEATLKSLGERVYVI